MIVQEREALTNHLRVAHESHKKYYDAKHKAISFKVKDKVLLSAKNIRQLRPNKKLSNRFLGPFEVIEIVGDHGQAYKLKLPPTYKIHNVFHVSLLEPWYGQETPEVDETESELVQVQDEPEFEVRSIQNHKDTNRGREYLVRWKGYSAADDTWEPASHLENAPEIVQEYLRDAPAADRIGGGGRTNQKRRRCRQAT